MNEIMRVKCLTQHVALLCQLLWWPSAWERALQAGAPVDWVLSAGGVAGLRPLIGSLVFRFRGCVCFTCWTSSAWEGVCACVRVRTRALISVCLFQLEREQRRDYFCSSRFPRDVCICIPMVAGSRALHFLGLMTFTAKKASGNTSASSSPYVVGKHLCPE